ncbi:glycosyltransferase [Marichromatium sp. AB32]|uniref:glycosyltransferase n=1 Tax=Marichromatium sp. AB32 TaxID=2483363 RepID=UPI000F3B5FEC|nr:glycosyltransferase [Marichromatium sp. AB32]RNE91782.1 colanic acid biosynthesis glycosyltransferase WcaL [Marichromatium sp. AB32]
MVRVGYLVSRFPTFTETFVLDEMLALEALGAEITLFPLLRERPRATHPQLAHLRAEVVYSRFVSGPILRANLALALRRPWRYLRTLIETFARVAPSRNFTLGAAGIFLKSVYIAREAERRGIGRLHAHFCTHPTLAAWIAHRLTGARYSFTAHGSDLHVDQTMLAEKLRRADFAVMISRYNRDFTLARVGARWAERLRVIHCGIDTGAFAPLPPRADAGDGVLHILCVASLRRVKGHVHLLRACAQLAAEGRDWTLTLVGDGRLRAELEAECRALGIAPRVRFLGQLTRPEVTACLRDCDVVALTSVQDARGRREGIPVSLMEALAVERPVVASRLSGIPELVEHGRTGLLAAPGEPAAIAAALARVADHPEEARALARAGRARVLAEFDLSDNAARLHAALAASPG